MVATSIKRDYVRTVERRTGGYLDFVMFVGSWMILERNNLYHILKSKKVNSGAKNFTGI